MTHTQDPIASLLPHVGAAADAALTECHLRGYGRLHVTEGYRTEVSQAALYGQGRSAKQLRRVGLPESLARPKAPIVTKATPDQSFHCKRRAVDVNIGTYPRTHWPAIAAIWIKHGFTWGGRWLMRDYSHFEYRG